MQQQDLQQISNLLDQKFKENNKTLRNELDQKLDQKFKENNKTLRNELDQKLDQKFKETNKTLRNELDQKLDQKFKENNKTLRKEIVEEVVEEIGAITNQAFSEFEERMDKKFDRVNKELAKRPTRKEMFDWADKKIVPLELDMDKVKYIHLDEWNKLPPAIEVSRTLVENKLKKRQ